jgi:broad specificity phosphatase PhoE
MSRVLVIRHGRPASAWGDAAEDPGLDPTGLEQASAVAAHLLSLPAGQRPRRVVSSPLRRCRETAEPTARALGLDLEIDPRVGEIPTPRAMLAADRPAWLRKAFEGGWAQIEGDLDYGRWAQDVATALTELADAAVFSHFVALNAAVAVATSDSRVATFRPDHASITQFEVRDGRLLLVSKGREAQSQVL